MNAMRIACVPLLALIALPACTHAPTGAGSTPAAAARASSGIYPQGKLQLTADPAQVLVSIDGDPALTVGEFNDRLMEFPIGDLGQDVASARRQVVEQMIDTKLIAREAARRWPAMKHGEGGAASVREERALVQSLIKTDVANPFLVSDQEARTYYESHRAAFGQLDDAKLADEERMLNIKFTILSGKLKERLRAWRSEQTIAIADDLLKS
jgi:hypothetical protein